MDYTQGNAAIESVLSAHLTLSLRNGWDAQKHDWHVVRDYMSVTIDLGRQAGHSTWALKQAVEGRATIIYPSALACEWARSQCPINVTSLYEIDTLKYNLHDLKQLIVVDSYQLWPVESLNQLYYRLHKFVAGTDRVIVRLG